MRVMGYSSNALGVILKYLGVLSGALCTRQYQAVSDVQLVKQRKMVKKRDRRGRATNEGGFYHYTFLVRKK